jgi:hypothetical protein
LVHTLHQSVVHIKYADIVVFAGHPLV